MKSAAQPRNHAQKNEQKNELVAVLNQSLADAIDVRLAAKQAHWNVKGENFIALHELFDKVSTEVDGYVDMLAERAVQLGGLAQGTLQAAAKYSRLPAYPITAQDAEQHVKALGSAIGALADETRRAIETSDTEGDAVTADLFTEIARGLDKLRWFVESHSR
jgi:starvation-inducible DNA-binding protein